MHPSIIIRLSYIRDGDIEDKEWKIGKRVRFPRRKNKKECMWDDLII